jgi:hypothetical protein
MDTSIRAFRKRLHFCNISQIIKKQNISFIFPNKSNQNLAFKYGERRCYQMDLHQLDKMQSSIYHMNYFTR